ncbi:formate dehydrogenase subunit gamma [Roseovarius salinarum]|uniref:formate dehydrogenase subunit gamma n=1 Tax=Roseovarius salinarum TaxID=1981892 RepID=UPI000C33ED47|nr:formate dehydrogenase subunit gamma [Roseovarius salinarum]
MARLLSMFLLSLVLAAPVSAQDGPGLPETDRSATGGATTLEDILARQRGEEVDNAYRRNATGDDHRPPEAAEALGPLGGLSDSEVWRDLRFNDADVTVSAGGDPARVLVQDRGMWWQQFREGPLARYGAWLLGATLVLLALFFLVRGRIRIDGEKTGHTVTRFQFIERFSHWLMAGSFILLALTGLITLFGRKLLIPAFGKAAFADVAMASKWLHNNVAWAFMLGLVMAFVLWVVHNLPDRTDLKWLAQGGGIFSKGKHPPAKKFNAGQKLIFWAVTLLGASVAASGLSLLFPFELPMFAKTFAILNDTGLPQLLGLGTLPETLAPHEEMQYAQLWHSIVAFILMAIILAHIYIGSVGMEGAFDAMGSGQVEEQWAREHHSLWLEELEEKERSAPDGKSTPAE